MVLRESVGELAQHNASWVDVRDWSVRTLVDNALAGVVHELLLDDRNIPRYLDVALTTSARHVLVPVGQARADRIHRQIWLPGFAHDQFETIPSYAHEPLSRGDEARLINAYSAAMAGAVPRGGYRVLGTGPRQRLRPYDPRRLVPLSQNSALRVGSGEADPRRWSVVDRAGNVCGSVVDLLVDVAAMKVRYLICDLEAGENTGRRVLVPVEFVRLDAGSEAAAMPAFSAELLQALESFNGEPPERENEALILERFAEAQESEDFYRHPRFDPAAFFGTR
jgi:photosynthetic reaction center H subunit